MPVFFSALLQVLAPHTFGIMLVGIAIGLIVGILPGLGGAATLALMLPFVYPMDAVSAFAFLLGMHSVTATTGDITSVLFGIPGEATSAATVLDGYPMTRRGEAGRALGAVLFSSLIGAFVGAAVLAASVPVIRPIVLAFGPPEFLMLTLLGLSFIISLSGRHLIKGAIMAAFGFLLAMVGLDPQSSIQRFTFGQLYLWEGINVVPVVVGLFGGAEILQLMMTKGSIAQHRDDRRIAGVMQGVRDTFDHIWLTLRASAIGVAIGVIPGMGGAVSQFIAYAHAQQTSKHPETFGKGNVEGVLAAGAVNNAREGGNLIPTVAFGIPGSISMAILLSVFLLKGLVPGPAMLTRNLIVTYSMVWVIVLSNVVAVSVSFLFLNHLARLTHVKGTLLVPFLLVLTAFGAYTAHNSMADIVLMLGALAIGIVAIRWDWPRAPLLLALVLGDIAERYLFLSYSLYEWNWLTRPLVIAFATITIAGVAWPFVRARISARRLTSPARVEADPHTGADLPAFAKSPAGEQARPRLSRGDSLGRRVVSADLVITVGFLIASVGVLLQARQWPFRTAVFPIMTGAILLGMALLKLVLSFSGVAKSRLPAPEHLRHVPGGPAASALRASAPREGPPLRDGDGAEARHEPGRQADGHVAPVTAYALLDEDEAADGDAVDIFTTASRRQWLSALAWMAAFFVLLWLVGALVTVPLFAMIYLMAASRESPALAGIYALASWAFVYGLFDRVLHIPLPEGVLLSGL